MIGKMLGFLLVMECLLLFPPALISIYDGETQALRGLFITMILSAGSGGALWLFCRGAERSFYAREGLLTTALGWIILSVVGALPLWLSGEVPLYIDALFEVISGFTTTGASILPDVEALSRGILFWRSFTHWMGGMGILVFLMAVIPMGKGGYSVHLLRAESPGPEVGKLVPRIRQTAVILYTIYFLLTILDVLFLLAGGMPLFDSLCTAFGTAGTGGFGIKRDSMAGYSPYLQNVCTVFMALFGVNFNVYFLLCARRFRQALHNEELRLYLAILIGSMFLIALNIQGGYSGFPAAFHDAAFAVSSVMTTTGFATADFNLWPQFSRSILVVLMVVGACAGSTGGGVKVSRIIILIKSLTAQIRRLLHPRSVNLVRVDGHTLDSEVIQGASTYMSAYCAIGVFSFLVLSLDGFSLETNLTAMLACLNNIGPGLDMVGPAGNYAMFSVPSKVVLILDMLLGRLEIFPLLVMLSPRTWNRAG